MQITFTNARNFSFGNEFDILLNGQVIGTCLKPDDYPSCVYCTTGLELPGREGEIEFIHEWGRNKRQAQRDIKRELEELLPRYLTGDAITIHNRGADTWYLPDHYKGYSCGWCDNFFDHPARKDS